MPDTSTTTEATIDAPAAAPATPAATAPPPAPAEPAAPAKPSLKDALDTVIAVANSTTPSAEDALQLQTRVIHLHRYQAGERAKVKASGSGAAPAGAQVSTPGGKKAEAVDLAPAEAVIVLID